MSLFNFVGRPWKRLLLLGAFFMLVGGGLVYWSYVDTPRLFLGGLVFMAIALVGATIQRLRS